jgi:hypothetical protein
MFIELDVMQGSHIMTPRVNKEVVGAALVRIMLL